MFLIFSPPVVLQASQAGVSVQGATKGPADNAAAALNPFPEVSRAKLLEASKAQEAGPNEVLDKAWHFYGEFLGSWVPNAPKPNATSIKAFDDFSASIKALPLPSWIVDGSADAKTTIKKVTLQVGDPHFKDLCQTAETQKVKALCLVLMTEHELDRPGGGAWTAAKDLYLLTERTPLDPDARMLFAKIALDAKDFELSWYNARLGIFLSTHPSRSDLEFFCFVGAFAAKDQWASIQAVVRELAETPQAAEDVITKQAVLFSDQAHAGSFPPKNNAENQIK